MRGYWGGRGETGSGRQQLSLGLDKPIWHSWPLKSPTEAVLVEAGQVPLCLIWTIAVTTDKAEAGLWDVGFCLHEEQGEMNSGFVHLPDRGLPAPLH